MSLSTSGSSNPSRGSEAERCGSPLAAALIGWQQAAGVYWPYVNATPFLGDLASVPTAPLSGGRARPISALLRPLLQTIAEEFGVALFVDLAPARTLPATLALNRGGFVVVPIIERWVAPVTFVPCDVLVSDLTAFGAVAINPSLTRGVVFLLDGDRTGSQGPLGPRSAKRLDNRYRYSIHRFPPPAFLRNQGIHSVRWLSADGIATDLQPYVDRLHADGLPVEAIRAGGG